MNPVALKYTNGVRHRHGEPDWTKPCFPQRDERLAKWRAAQAMPTVSTPPQRGSRLSLWTECLAKIRSAERFAVEQGFSGNDPVLKLLELEERYHSDLLGEVLQQLGAAPLLRRPSVLTRVLFWAMSALPAALHQIEVYLGERVGLAVFLFLRAQLPSVASPTHLPFLELLLDDVIADEKAHVWYAQALLSTRQLAIAQRLLPLTRWAVTQELPELQALAGKKGIQFMLAQLESANDTV